MPRTKLVNGVRTPLSAGEEADRDAVDLDYTNNGEARQIGRLQSRYRQSRDQGIMMNIEGEDVKIVTSNDVVQELEKMIQILTASGAPDKEAVTRGGVIIAWTIPLAVDALAQVVNHIEAASDNEVQLTKDIRAAADPESVDIDVGWPV